MSAFLLALGGCAVVTPSFPSQAVPTKEQQAAQLEPMLQTAGFQELPATTAEQRKRLAALPSLKLGYYLDQQGRPNYWMADPDHCGCLFHGDEADYQRYQQLRADSQLAERDRQAMQAQRFEPQAPMMGPFGPPVPFGPGLGFSFGPGIGFGGAGFGFSL